MSVSPAGRSSLCSPALPSTSAHMFEQLDAAAEQLMVHRDFTAAFHACNMCLEALAGVGVEEEDDEEEEEEGNRYGELKTGFCVVGIQALAEMNEWRGVFPWLQQQYGAQQRIPAKLMQMCILLYAKVGEAALMQEAAGDWLACPSNRRSSGFRTVAELYLLHVLVPLGHTDQARQLIVGEVGSSVFTEDQRQTALDVVEEREQQQEEAAGNAQCEPDATVTAHSAANQGHVLHKLESMLRLLYRKLFVSGSGFSHLRRFFLAAVLLYMLFMRMDPALPSSFMWISKLLQLLKQMWNAMFAPYYQALPHSKEL